MNIQNFQLSQKQSIVTTAMMTSLHILQMTNLQLHAYVQNLMNSNVVIDIGAFSEQLMDSAVPLEFDYYDPRAAHMEYSHTSTVSDSDPNKEQFIRDKAREKSIVLDLNAQASALGLPKIEQLILNYLISLLDKNGRLEETDSELAALLNQDIQLIQKCVSHLQSLEPAGVGARDLSECILLQLQRMSEDTRLAEQIVAECLPELSKKQFKSIAKTLHVSVGEISKACAQICSTNPKPLNGLTDDTDNGYIVPDIRVVRENTGFRCILNERFIPKIRIDPHYLSLIHNKDYDPEARDYLRKCYTQASDIQRYITYRSSTLQQVMEYVLRVQQGFFINGPGHRAAMSNREIAEALNLHDSTISRAINGKYFECDWGVFPLKSLFSRSLQTDEQKTSLDYDRVIAIIRKLIAAEDASKPFSDQAISDALGNMGIRLSRRTVSKYRTEQKIPSAAHRRALKQDPL